MNNHCTTTAAVNATRPTWIRATSA